MARMLAIDFGERRIGLALCDDEGRLAWPWRTLERVTDRRAVYQIAELARHEGVATLVLGEPRDPEGRPGAAAARVRRFGHKLARASGLPILWIEETLTTLAAAERLTEAGLDAPRDPDGRRDAVAAQILLEEALAQGRREG